MDDGGCRMYLLELDAHTWVPWPILLPTVYHFKEESLVSLQGKMGQRCWQSLLSSHHATFPWLVPYRGLWATKQLSCLRELCAGHLLPPPLWGSAKHGGAFGLRGSSSENESGPSRVHWDGKTPFLVASEAAASPMGIVTALSARAHPLNLRVPN